MRVDGATQLVLPARAGKRRIKAPGAPAQASAARSLPSVKKRIAEVLRTIDWSKPEIVIWVPGTAEHFISPPFLQAAAGAFPNGSITMIPYRADTQFSDSVKDGAAVLRGVLEAIAKRGGSQKIYLSGLSQGAWVVSDVMADPKLGAMIERAALLGHPGAAQNHHHSGTGKVMEINHDGDFVTRSLGADQQRVIEAVEGLFAGKRFSSLISLAGYVAKNPAQLGVLLLGQLNRVPGFKEAFPSPHNYEYEMIRGVAFLRTGQRVAVGEH